MDEILKLIQEAEQDNDVFTLFPEARPKKTFFRALTGALVLLFATLGLWGVSQAKAETIRGEGAFCDSADAITKFMAVWNGNNEVDALSAANTKSDGPACVLAIAEFEEITRMAVVTTPTGKMWHLTSIAVSAITAGGKTTHYPKAKKMFVYVPLEKAVV